MKRTILSVLCCAVMTQAVLAAKKSSEKPADVFYVYSDKGNPRNHYIPSGWMGDYGDLKLDDGSREDCADGLSCIKWTYSAKKAQGANWAGCFWQHPANNWGEKPGGFDLTGFKRLTFWARGTTGKEVIAEFKIGGITGTHGDSDAASIGPVTLTKEWKKYTIDLSDKNLSKIVGGFAWAASGDDNPDGFVLYLDEIRFEGGPQKVSMAIDDDHAGKRPN